MTLQQLRYALTIAGCGSMNEAAKRLFLSQPSLSETVKELEQEMLTRVNQLGIGPGGLGGRITALAVNIETFATHIAGLPVAVNICCHVNRHANRIL